MKNNPRITITLFLSEWKEIANAAQSYEDKGPCGAGWQSSELWGASDSLDVALSQQLKDLPKEIP